MLTHTLTLLYKIDYDYVQVSTELIALHKLHTDLKFFFSQNLYCRYLYNQSIFEPGVICTGMIEFAEIFNRYSIQI